MPTHARGKQAPGVRWAVSKSLDVVRSDSPAAPRPQQLSPAMTLLTAAAAGLSPADDIRRAKDLAANDEAGRKPQRRFVTMPRAQPGRRRRRADAHAEPPGPHRPGLCAHLSACPRPAVDGAIGCVYTLTIS
eukprot:4358557-Prymnesium_polylepis.1